MVCVCWATHVLQKWKQRVTIIQIGVDLKKPLQFGLFSETRKYEAEIVSNRRLVCYGE